jgi:hypothetical protein
MNHTLVPFGREEVFAELTEHIVELRETSKLQRYSRDGEDHV